MFARECVDVLGNIYAHILGTRTCLCSNITRTIAYYLLSKFSDPQFFLTAGSDQSIQFAVCPLLFNCCCCCFSHQSYKCTSSLCVSHKGIPGLYHVSDSGQEEGLYKQEKEIMLPLGALLAPDCLQLKDLYCLLNHLCRVLVLPFKIFFCQQPFS